MPIPKVCYFTIITGITVRTESNSYDSRQRGREWQETIKYGIAFISHAVMSQTCSECVQARSRSVLHIPDC